MSNYTTVTVSFFVVDYDIDPALDKRGQSAIVRSFSRAKRKRESKWIDKENYTNTTSLLTKLLPVQWERARY